MKYKIGDECIVKEGHKDVCYVFENYYNHDYNCYIRITNTTINDKYHYDILNSKGEKVSNCCVCLKDEHLKLKESNSCRENQSNNGDSRSSNGDDKNIDMDLLEGFALTMTPEPFNSYRQAKITDGDDVLTEDGVKVFLTWLLRSDIAKGFKADVVDKILKEQRKAASKKKD